MFTLGRDIDIHYPTNQLILILTAVSAVIGIFTSGDFITGVKIGGTIFLTWAFGRELDPKREYGAFVGVVFALYSFFVPFDVGLMELFFLLLLLRLINTTSGDQPTLLDAGIVLIIAAFLSFNLKTPIYSLLYLIGIFLSDVFKKNQSVQTVLTFLAVGSSAYIIYRFISQGTFKGPILSVLTVVGLVLLYSLFAYIDKDKKIYDDQKNEIDSIKILKAQLFFAVTVVVLTFLTNPTIGNMILYASTMAGLIVYGQLSKIVKIEDD